MESSARKLIKIVVAISLIATTAVQTIALGANTPQKATNRQIIMFVWDGLRPDSINLKDTPTLFKLKKKGVWFSDNHASYPTFTMMNAASFATGNLAGKTGFYGNTLWAPLATGTNAEGIIQNFKAPIFTEDYKILQAINNPNNSNNPLFYTETLFGVAHRYGLTTATVGKSGPAFIQNYHQEAGMNGIVFDEKHIYPLNFAKVLVNEGYPIPKFSPLAYPQGQLQLPFDNGDPTKFYPVETLKVISSGALGLSKDFMFPENATSDPTTSLESPYSSSNEYLMNTFLDKILTTHPPKLTVIWLRNPDTTAHNYGVGSASYLTALHDQDHLLQKLLNKLKSLNLEKSTDLIIVSDHSHSNVSGPFEQFPLRLIHHGFLSVPDTNGYAVSGDFRPADLLTRAGFNAFDGQGCQYDPALSGIKSNGSLVYPIQTDKTGKVCGASVKVADPFGHRNQIIGHLYTTKGYRIPKHLPQDGIIVANNGGSTYFYIVNHNPQLTKKVVHFLQSRQEFGAIFVDDQYSQIKGVLPMSVIHIKNPQGRNPDIIASSSFDENAVISGIKGVEFSSSSGARGMHGSFSHIDIHNTLLALGPDFKKNFVDPLPCANIDVPATIAYLLNLPLSNIDGRPLLEALKNGLPLSAYSLVNATIKPNTPAENIVYQLATDPNGKDIDKTKTHYTIALKSKVLIVNNKMYQYYDRAIAKRY